MNLTYLTSVNAMDSNFLNFLNIQKCLDALILLMLAVNVLQFWLNIKFEYKLIV